MFYVGLGRIGALVPTVSGIAVNSRKVLRRTNAIPVYRYIDPISSAPF